jgi:shikimate kinase
MSYSLRKNIVLTGFMGTGKTSTGRVLARKLGTRFIDTDKLIEKEAGILIGEIFEKLGEPYFRRLEREIVKKVSEEIGVVIAVGGGAIVNPANLADLKRHGIVVSLTATPEVILSRIEMNLDRPLLKVKDKIGKIKDLLVDRAPYYEKANITVNTDDKSPEQVAEEILEAVRSET